MLVGRNLAKTIFERRRGLIGSKLQVRLVFGFIAVALVPSAFLLYVSGAFLHADIDSWFNPEYERVLDDSLEIAKVYYLNSANNAAHFARVLAGLVARARPAQARRIDERLRSSSKSASSITTLARSRYSPPNRKPGDARAEPAHADRNRRRRPIRQCRWARSRAIR